VKTALYSALLLLALAVTGAVLVLSYDMHQDLRSVKEDLASIHLMLGQASETTHNLSTVMTKVSATADTLNAAAGEERANWKATSMEADKTGRALRMLISRVDRSFVDGTLYHVNSQTLPAIDAQIAQNGAQLAATLAKVGETADSLTLMTGSLNARLGDPAISQLLGHVNVVASNLEVISANSAAMSGDMKVAVHRLAQPPTKIHQVLNVAWTTAKFGSLFVP
jgi:methyl-accepting chemotaxis protein